MVAGVLVRRGSGASGLWNVGGRVAAMRVAITYCTQCQWLLRAGWMAQELLQTFGSDLTEVALIPGTGGVFRVVVGESVVWDRKERGGFPEITVLKQLVRDEVDPERDLGHADRP
ncbi:selenoprotein W-related protein [Rhodococcus sp. SORGH_AS303]|jgi:selenoprotein W-related protein|nr:selenoprotein W-related protein [Rhodococcus sp. SORGH_AS_0303]